MDNITMRAAALTHAKLGRKVFPCSPKTKAPLTQRGFKDATTDEGQICAWWTQHPDAMIGTPPGREAGFFVVDCDGQEGVDNFLMLAKEHDLDLNTYWQHTPSGGRHYFFAYPEDLPEDTKIGNSASKLAPKVDVRGDGGYIILAPSINGAGKPYTIGENSHE